tara:strand:+ start:470 stop:1279 length:810 start_codon:yes stop_codon:yes gene_type:complete
MNTKKKIEILVSAMHQKDVSLISKMNINTDCVLINQTDFNSKEKISIDNRTIKFESYNETGLSLSRNKAIKSSSNDICVIADDDLFYVDNCEDIIQKAYSDIPDADIIIFNVISTNKKRASNIFNKKERLGFFKSMKVYSYQMSFLRKSIINNQIKFNTLFGAGSETYSCGEENIFLNQCVKLGLKIYSYPETIAKVDQQGSTWFKGYNYQYFRTKGAMFYALSKKYSFFLILQFAIRKYGLYKNETSFFNALKYMRSGKNEYKGLLGE